MYIALVYWTSSILRVKRLPQLSFGHLRCIPSVFVTRQVQASHILVISQLHAFCVSETLQT